LLRDSVDAEGTRFRDHPIGAAFTDASAKNATAIYRYCPTALVFGVWDSTGPHGGLGHKIQRALVSEVIGVGAVVGVKTTSRLDPAGIQSTVPVYHRRDDRDEWTTDESEALLEKGKPVLFSRKGTEGKGKPSAINHSNVAPSIDGMAGGVTLDYALQTTVLSLPALRRLRFQADAKGARLEGERRASAERAARCVLAALALVAVTELREQGYDLRSRSFLIPEEGGPLSLELVPSDGGESKRFSLTTSGAADLLSSAVAEATKVGLPWDREPLALKPAPKLAGLIRESRRRAATGDAEETEAGS
jgi:CRISPR-associated protein Csb1